MAPKTLTVTEAVRNFSDYVNRVAYCRESFVLWRGKKPIAELRPAASVRRLRDLPEIFKALPKLSAEEARAFAGEIRKSRKSLPAEKPRNPWES